MVNIYELLSTICTPLTHCASSLSSASLSAPSEHSLASDASPTPSDCSDQIQAQPDVTPTLRALVSSPKTVPRKPRLHVMRRKELDFDPLFKHF